MNAENPARGQTQIELIRCINVEWLTDCASIAKELIRATSEASTMRVRRQGASAVRDELGVLAMYSEIDVIELVFSLRLLQFRGEKGYARAVRPSRRSHPNRK